MKLIVIEVKKLINDYYRCNNHQLKKEILIDINLLNDALRISGKNNSSQENTERLLGF